MSLATKQGKKHAVEKLKIRREMNKNVKKIDNRSLHAGSPMYYYCKSCNEVIMLPELHLCPVPALCQECQALKDLGWLE